MIAFVIFNGLSALVNDYYTMMIVRFLSGLPHGAFFGVGTVVATRLAKPGKQAQSIAMMFTGLTLANLAMVPFVTWLGHQLSWRYAFGVVSVLGLLMLISLKFLLPYMDSLRTTTLKDELEFFKSAKPGAWVIKRIVPGTFLFVATVVPVMRPPSFRLAACCSLM